MAQYGPKPSGSHMPADEYSDNIELVKVPLPGVEFPHDEQSESQARCFLATNLDTYVVAPTLNEAKLHRFTINHVGTTYSCSGSSAVRELNSPDDTREFDPVVHWDHETKTVHNTALNTSSNIVYTEDDHFRVVRVLNCKKTRDEQLLSRVSEVKFNRDKISSFVGTQFPDEVIMKEIRCLDFNELESTFLENRVDNKMEYVVPQIYFSGVSDNNTLLVQEKVPGWELSKVMAMSRKTPLSHGAVYRIAEGFFDNLKKHHNAHTVHFDIKPTNCFLRYNALPSDTEPSADVHSKMVSSHHSTMEYDQNCDADGFDLDKELTVCNIDYGLAMSTRSPDFSNPTRCRLGGTAQYMSPKMARNLLKIMNFRREKTKQEAEAEAAPAVVAPLRSEPLQRGDSIVGENLHQDENNRAGISLYGANSVTGEASSGPSETNAGYHHLQSLRSMLAGVRDTRADMVFNTDNSAMHVAVDGPVFEPSRDLADLAYHAKQPSLVYPVESEVTDNSGDDGGYRYIALKHLNAEADYDASISDGDDRENATDISIEVDCDEHSLAGVNLDPSMDSPSVALTLFAVVSGQPFFQSNSNDKSFYEQIQRRIEEESLMLGESDSGEITSSFLDKLNELENGPPLERFPKWFLRFLRNLYLCKKFTDLEKDLEVGKKEAFCSGAPHGNRISFFNRRPKTLAIDSVRSDMPECDAYRMDCHTVLASVL